MPNEIHSYTELQQQIHQDLRVQHPEWVRPTGECPTCDSYELRLAELLGLTQNARMPAARNHPLFSDTPTASEISTRDEYETGY